MKVGITSLNMEHDSLVTMEVTGYERTLPPDIADAIHNSKQLYLKVEDKVKETWDQEEKWITNGITTGGNDTLTLEKFRAIKDKLKNTPHIDFFPINPCREVPIYDSWDGTQLYPWHKEILTQFDKEYKGEFMNNAGNDKRPHTARADILARNDTVLVSGQGMSGRLKVLDETATLRVELPGVEPDHLEIKQIDDMVRVRVNPPKGDDYDPLTMAHNIRQLYLILDGEEYVESTTLNLGVLEITIDRNRDIEEFHV